MVLKTVRGVMHAVAVINKI